MSLLQGKLWQKALKGSARIINGIETILGRSNILTQDILDELEVALLGADLGPKIVETIIKDLKNRSARSCLTATELKNIVIADVQKILDHGYASLFSGLDTLSSPYVIMLCGVNGSGKTTTVGKLAYMLKSGGAQVGLAACDTFRAAAAEQLASWSERVSIPIFSGKPNADPASVAYSAYIRAQELQLDYLLVDTSGRMHNNDNLMNELSKIERTIKKIDNNAPHKTVIVVDGSTGQNMRKQIEAYIKSVRVDGIILTKLDGSARGGAVLSIVTTYNLPIYYICTGEGLEDIAVFDSKEFAEALLSA